MKSILLALALLVSLESKHLQQQSFQDTQCSVNINGVDLATKVNGKIIKYLGTENDKDNKVSITTLIVSGKNGQRKQVIRTPCGKNGEFSKSAGCMSSYGYSSSFSNNNQNDANDQNQENDDYVPHGEYGDSNQ